MSLGRISTASAHERAVAALLQRQAELSRTQDQIASGRRVRSAADDPIAAVHIQEIERGLAESTQFARNADAARARLSFEEQALTDAGNVLQRVRELAVQTTGGILDPGSRAMIATEMEERLRELLDVANRRDGNGEYLFAGFSTSVAPFVRATGGGFVYAGDAGVRFLQVGPAQRVADGHPGADVFFGVREGNGRFVTAPLATNTGTGIIDTGAVPNPAAWSGGNHTLRFVTAASWEIVDAANAVVASGAYVPGAPIQWNGAQVTVTGAPASGDRFTLEASASEDLFTTLESLIATVRSDTATPAARAQVASRMGGALAQLDRGIDHLLKFRAEVGARLSGLDQAEEARDALETDMRKTLSELRDLDYAEAVSRMNQQYAGLQAAQAAYARFAQLSLFDHI